MPQRSEPPLRSYLVTIDDGPPLPRHGVHALAVAMEVAAECGFGAALLMGQGTAGGRWTISTAGKHTICAWAPEEGVA
jgi:hypothetical protein